MFKLYNTLNNKKEEFVPIDENHIKIYVCGPTVYNEIHVGNARSIVVFDLLHRVMKHLYKNVTFVRNITDIDDKIIKKANEMETTSSEIAVFFEKSFIKNCEILNLLNPTYSPKATETIKEIIEFIAELIELDYAYFKDGDVYFDVSMLNNYGQLSKKENLIEAHRIEFNDLKEDQRDFVLWKQSKLNEPYWNSPWGKGRPGWHIECSAMSKKFLGEQFDIHAGGQDLIFPHHENEIAQNQGLCGENAGPKYWMHNAMLLFDGEKMSKSIGNIVLLSEAFSLYEPMFIKFFILSTNYKHMLHWNDENIKNSANRFDKWMFHLQKYFDNNEEILTEIVECLYDDLNSVKAFSKIDEILDDAIKNNDSLLFSKIAATLKFMGFEYKNKLPLEHYFELLKKREIAKLEKNFEKADEIRKILNKDGFEIIDRIDKSEIIFKYKSIL